MAINVYFFLAHSGMGMSIMMHPYESYYFNKNIHACLWVPAMVLFNLTAICQIDLPFIRGL